MGFIRKAIHLKPQFGDDNFADAHINPSHLIEDVNRRRAAEWLRDFLPGAKGWSALRRRGWNDSLFCLLFGC